MRLDGRAAMAAALLLAAALAGCGQGGRQEAMRSVGQLGLQELRRSLGMEAEGPRAEPATMTRAEIEAFPAALIAASIDGAPPAYFHAAADNGGYVAYQGTGAQTLTFRGAALTATHGLTEDRAGYRSDPARDPLIAPRPPQDWPDRVVRALRFRDSAGKPFSRVFRCAPRVVGPATVTIAGLDFPLIEIEEPCRSPRHAFVNRYWAEAETGRVWKSEQWIGPLRGALTIEVLKPYAG